MGFYRALRDLTCFVAIFMALIRYTCFFVFRHTGFFLRLFAAEWLTAKEFRFRQGLRCGSRKSDVGFLFRV